MTDWEDYFYPGTTVLRNKFGIQDQDALAEAERLAVQARIEQGCPTGNFDLAHIQAIHRHLFQDVYEWAGELRQVDMFKNHPDEYASAGSIDWEVSRVHKRAVDADFLRNTNVWEFSAGAAEIIGDINHAHPFREGNTRTQLQCLQQLGEQAGHNIDLTRIDRAAWNVAKIEAGRGNYGVMNDQIRAAIVPTLERAPPPVAEPTWEQVVKDDEALRTRELQDQREAQQEALRGVMTAVEKRGNDPDERAEKQRAFDELCERQLAATLREQQERRERLEALYKGQSAERER